MEKKLREKKVSWKKSKKTSEVWQCKEEENLNKIKVDEPLSLDFITNPDKGKWI